MNSSFLIQTAASLVAIGLMVALAAWAKIARAQPPLDEARARALIAEDFPGKAPDAVWVAADGAGAIAKAGSFALVLVRVGDGYAARQIPWAEAAASRFEAGRLRLELADVAAPRASLSLAAWPPDGLAA